MDDLSKPKTNLLELKLFYDPEQPDFTMPTADSHSNCFEKKEAKKKKNTHHSPQCCRLYLPQQDKPHKLFSNN